jgi:hypothetical protein
VEVGDEIVAFAGHQAELRPAPCGSSAGHVAITAGTIGCLCISRRSNRVCLLSNNHVLANCNFAQRGDFIIQPGKADFGTSPEDVVASLEDFIPLNASGISQVDAAIGFTAYRFVSPQHFGFTIDPRPLPAAPFMSVKKCGRTTGFTTGMVTGTNASVPVKYEPAPQQLRPSFVSTFNGQITIQGGFGVFSRGGDSGSLIVEALSNRPVGLLFAGNPQGTTFANPIQQVIQALDIELINSEV